MKNKKQTNYLSFIPRHTESLSFTIGEEGMVTLEIENKGILNRLFQKVLKKPKISYIHLDDLGSFIWNQIDGQTTVFQISEKVKETYGEKAEPLYDRLIKYLEILKNNKFIIMK